MENKQIEAIINATFPGLMFFCRDLDLDGQLIAEALIESEFPAVQGRTAKINDVSH